MPGSTARSPCCQRRARPSWQCSRQRRRSAAAAQQESSITSHRRHRRCLRSAKRRTRCTKTSTMPLTPSALPWASAPPLHRCALARLLCYVYVCTISKLGQQANCGLCNVHTVCPYALYVRRAAHSVRGCRWVGVACTNHEVQALRKDNALHKLSVKRRRDEEQETALLMADAVNKCCINGSSSSG